MFLDAPERTSVYKTIHHYLICESNDDNYIDFVSCGNVGMSTNKRSTLGSVAECIVRAKNMNVIFTP
tara:strand:- start:471 stop:671 length:201 start_codon:yes stop_codon:yes gene_type:complete